MNINFLLIEPNLKITEEIKKAFSHSEHPITSFDIQNVSQEAMIAELEEFCRTEKFHFVLLENDLTLIHGVDLMPVFSKSAIKVIAFANSYEGNWRLECAGAYAKVYKDYCYTSRGFDGNILLKGLKDWLQM